MRTKIVPKALPENKKLNKRPQYKEKSVVFDVGCKESPQNFMLDYQGLGLSTRWQVAPVIMVGEGELPTLRDYSRKEDI